jgi:predicted esterase YcpF (UPF0227 family)
MSDAPEPVTHLLYLHGFRSSPQSSKARVTGDWVRSHRPDIEWLCPQLPASPADAMRLVLEGIDSWPAARMAVIGSSLGGYYATAVAERTGCRAVLLNPAVDPARDLDAHVGETTSWHSGEPFVFLPGYIDELRAWMMPALQHPERYFAVIAKGDELLSWQEMLGRYRDGSVKLLEGSDHALTDYDRHLPDVIHFLGLDHANR